ncbi:MAG: N-6 DNA methylase [Ruminococcus sp.]|nr:N-6 DNA methylase [Ruminococcus sp.]
MDYSQLKRFAARQRSLLLAESEEKAAYCAFMRLCALTVADWSALEELNALPLKLRYAFFREKCRQFGESFGGIFSLYGELPLPSQLLAEDGTSAELQGLQHKYFGDLRVLGWLHQYYNEPYREEIAVGLKSSKRLSAERVAAATQIFTPDWIAGYMVQNTLGRFLRCHGFDIATGEAYFGDDKICKESIRPEDIKLIDPCLGCGNILLSAFDVFMGLYRNCGVPEAVAAEKIMRLNLFGLELDERACAVAETALRLKSAEYGALVKPQVYDLAGVSEIAGSLINGDDIRITDDKTAAIGRILNEKYDIIVTNPPYLGKAAMNIELSGFIGEYYSAYGADLFSVFIARTIKICANNGLLGFLTPSTWLFLQSYEKLRQLIYKECSIQTMLHFEYSAFDDATVPLCAFTMKKTPDCGRGTYLRLTDFKGDMDLQRQKCLEGIRNKSCTYRYEADTSNFLRIPTAPVAYWLGKRILKAFDGVTLGETVPVREGLITGDNDRFLRRWYEVDKDKIDFTVSHKKKWCLLNKGGEYRKWYGNREFVVNWENEGTEIKSFRDVSGKLRSRPQSLDYNFRPSVSWSQITSGELSVRYFDSSFMFNVAGTSAFPRNECELLLLLGLLNSKTASALARVLNPTLNMNPGDLARLPLPEFPDDCQAAEELVRENIRMCREDWDSFETSFEFKRHPLI